MRGAMLAKLTRPRLYDAMPRERLFRLLDRARERSDIQLATFAKAGPCGVNYPFGNTGYGGRPTPVSRRGTRSCRPAARWRSRATSRWTLSRSIPP
jgi:hypothetical protein